MNSLVHVCYGVRVYPCTSTLLDILNIHRPQALFWRQQALPWSPQVLCWSLQFLFWNTQALFWSQGLFWSPRTRLFSPKASEARAYRKGRRLSTPSACRERRRPSRFRPAEKAKAFEAQGVGGKGCRPAPAVKLLISFLCLRTFCKHFAFRHA